MNKKNRLFDIYSSAVENHKKHDLTYALSGDYFRDYAKGDLNEVITNDEAVLMQAFHYKHSDEYERNHDPEFFNNFLKNEAANPDPV